jgi:hypothetical protein
MSAEHGTKPFAEEVQLHVADSMGDASHVGAPDLGSTEPKRQSVCVSEYSKTSVAEKHSEDLGDKPD